MSRARLRHRGMTLFELAVVVSIAAILVILAVLSTRSLVIRTKVSRVLEEHRVLARALQNYAMDHTQLPTPHQGFGPLQDGGYLPNMPRDIFQPQRPPYILVNPGVADLRPFLVSVGPDGQLDLPEELHRFATGTLMPGRAASTSSSTAGTGGPANPDLPEPRITDREAEVLRQYLSESVLGARSPNQGDIVTFLH